MNHWINKFLQFSFIYLVPIHDTNHLKALYNWKNTLHLCGENPNNQTTPYEKELGEEKKTSLLTGRNPRAATCHWRGWRKTGQFVLFATVLHFSVLYRFSVIILPLSDNVSQSRWQSYGSFSVEDSSYDLWNTPFRFDSANITLVINLLN